MVAPELTPAREGKPKGIKKRQRMGENGGQKKAKKLRWVDGLSWADVTPINGEEFLTGAEEGGFMQLEEIDGDVFMEAAKSALGPPSGAPEKADTKGTLAKQKPQAEREPEQEGGEIGTPGEDGVANQKKTKSKKKKKKGKKIVATEQKPAKDLPEDGEARPEEETTHEEESRPEEGPSTSPACDTSAWAEFGLHPKLMSAIASLGFEKPTEVQKQCLPKAIKHGKDIVGAAETGSGKTLAFGLPILQRLLEEQDKQALKTGDRKLRNLKLKALILTPTRELALQVCDHLKAAARFTDILVVPIVGGIATPKQERLLRKRPAIVVGTPGRLWELMSSGEQHLIEVEELRFFVLDEADRMVEKGHFKELQSIVDLLPGGKKPKKNASHEENEGAEDAQAEAKVAQPKRNRQTFVFSATLMVPPSLKKKLKAGRITAQGKAAGMVGQLVDRAGVSRKASIIDLTSETLVAHRLEEAVIECLETEKDTYLYYLLRMHTGRTLVFCSAISAVRRVAAILKLLGVPAWPLHAGMQQRQRLKAMDRFRGAPDGVLVASDVAARGLDIPGVQTVIHYQLPLSAELYVHRSGRTARALADGCSVAIVSPAERTKLNALCKALKKVEGLPDFPVDKKYLPAVQQRVSLALKLDNSVREQQKSRAKKSWLHKNAEALGVDLEDEEEVGGDDDRGGSRLKRKREQAVKKSHKQQAAELKAMEQELAALVRKPLEPKRMSHSYLTGGGLSSLVAGQLQQTLTQNGEARPGVRAIGKKGEDALAALKSQR